MAAAAFAPNSAVYAQDDLPILPPLYELPGQDGPAPSIPLPDAFVPGVEDPNNPLMVPAPSRQDFVTDPARSQVGAGTVTISYDVDALPEPVKRMRALIMDAARSGDLENLRPLIGTGRDVTQLSLGGIEGDPIEFLRSISGDTQGHETLAILLEVFEAGYAHLDAGLPSELYVWPYFFTVSLEELTPVQRVELFKLVTAGDYDDMVGFGAYIFFRAAITPEGRWLFFVAGD
jgi:hypothetical protein